MDGLLHFCLSVQTFCIKHVVTVCVVVDRDASRTNAKCQSEHHGDEDYEQVWCQDSSLLGAVGNIKT